MESCPICLEVIPRDRVASTDCRHSFCTDCLLEICRQPRHTLPRCPLCRREVSQFKVDSDRNYLILAPGPLAAPAAVPGAAMARTSTGKSMCAAMLVILLFALTAFGNGTSPHRQYACHLDDSTECTCEHHYTAAVAPPPRDGTTGFDALPPLQVLAGTLGLV